MSIELDIDESIYKSINIWDLGYVSSISLSLVLDNLINKMNTVQESVFEIMNKFVQETLIFFLFSFLVAQSRYKVF